MSIEEQLIQLFEKNPNHYYKPRQLAKILKITERQYPAFKRKLKKLAEQIKTECGINCDNPEAGMTYFSSISRRVEWQEVPDVASDGAMIIGTMPAKALWHNRVRYLYPAAAALFGRLSCLTSRQAKNNYFTFSEKFWTAAEKLFPSNNTIVWNHLVSLVSQYIVADDFLFRTKLVLACYPKFQQVIKGDIFNALPPRTKLNTLKAYVLILCEASQRISKLKVSTPQQAAALVLRLGLLNRIAALGGEAREWADFFKLHLENIAHFSAKSITAVSANEFYAKAAHFASHLPDVAAHKLAQGEFTNPEKFYSASLLNRKLTINEAYYLATVYESLLTTLASEVRKLYAKEKTRKLKTLAEQVYKAAIRVESFIIAFTNDPKAHSRLARLVRQYMQFKQD